MTINMANRLPSAVASVVSDNNSSNRSLLSNDSSSSRIMAEYDAEDCHYSLAPKWRNHAVVVRAKTRKAQRCHPPGLEASLTQVGVGSSCCANNEDDDDPAASDYFYADVSRVIVKGPPQHMRDGMSHEELKEWVLDNNRDTLLQAMSITFEDEQSELEQCKHRLQLLDKVAQVQGQYLRSESPKVIYGCLLEGVLDLMESEYGFIGEVMYDADGTMYLQTYAITNIAWDEATQKFYEENLDAGLKFYNMNTLFGAVMTTQQPVISNHPQSDPRAGGIPEGHPPMLHFLGIPFFQKNGNIVGMVGIANKPGGYCEEDIEFLKPFTTTCGILVQAYWQTQRNKHLINTLEQKVAKRTQKLQLANESLAEANARVMQASQARLEHFACMSHEIRTPLNCILGLSSLLLKETELSPLQEESIQMITTSGDLLLKVVNDVLDYAKLESGHLEFEIETSNLQETLNTVVHSIEMKAANKNLVLHTYYDPMIPEYVQTDRQRLQQILFNLLGNAIKFSPENSVVELSVELCPAHEPLNEEMKVSDIGSHRVANEDEADDGNDTNCSLSVSNLDPPCKPASPHPVRPPPPHAFLDSETVPIKRCPFHRASQSDATPELLVGSESSTCPVSKSRSRLCVPDNVRSRIRHVKPALVEKKYIRNRMLRFVVKDYGKGIEEKDFERIFEPFQQASSETERLYGGTGLGLPITVKLVQGLGGTISVDSRVGEWSEFTVDFPLNDRCPVDVDKVSQKLENAYLCLVGSDELTSLQISKVFETYKVHFSVFSTLHDLENALRETRGRSLAWDSSQVCYCLVHENAYNGEVFERLSATSVAKPILITFGPNYSVEATKVHFRSLVRVLPSVLMQSIVDAPTHSRNKFKYHQLRRLSSTNSSSCSSEEKSDPVSALKVLVAEDNNINQKVLVRMLHKIGIKDVTVVDDGLQAVEQVKAHRFDVVLMDMQMPVMDGIEACRTIRGMATSSDRPCPYIVFVTAHAFKSYESECAKAGGDAFLPKPFNFSAIETLFHQQIATIIASPDGLEPGM